MEREGDGEREKREARAEPEGNRFIEVACRANDVEWSCNLFAICIRFAGGIYRDPQRKLIELNRW